METRRAGWIATLALLAVLTPAHGWDAWVYCHGKGTSSDGMDYDAWLNGPIDKADSLADRGKYQGRGNLQFSMTGRTADFKYDIENRFEKIGMDGVVTTGYRDLLTSFGVDWPVLPNKKVLQVSVPLQSPKGATHFYVERQQGGTVYGHLCCSVQLPQKCHMERRCTKVGHPHVGFDIVCKDVTICNPGQFASPEGKECS